MIKIQVINCNGLQPSQPFEAEFDELGGNIGRADNNTLVLPDPEKHISRIHATIEFRAGTFYICNHGSATPVFLNGHSLDKGQSDSIKAGDDIRIGGYTLRVVGDDRSIKALFEDTPLQSDTGSFERDIFAQPEENPFNMGQEHSSGAENRMLNADFTNDSDSFADPFAKNDQKAVSDLIPEDFDPFADLPASDGLSGDSKSRNKPNLLMDENSSSASEQDIDAYIESKSPVDELSEQSNMNSIDPLRVLEGVEKKKQPEFNMQRDDVPELHGSFDPPKLKRESEVKPGKQPVSPASKQKSYTGNQELLEAFLSGAGIQGRNIPVELTPEFMHLVGLILRTSTQGTLDLLLARSMTKQEMHANLTLIAPKENNPLKFSPDVETALAHLFASQSKGFMTSEQAIKDAYDDLRSHQFGFMAGMRAALAGLLDKFSPQRLERRFTNVSVVDKFVPINRKAKLWNSYTEHYQAISNEAEEDFHALFGKEFLQAYEKQITKLQDKG